MTHPEPDEDQQVGPVQRPGSVQLAVSTVILAMRKVDDEEHHSSDLA